MDSLKRAARIAALFILAILLGPARGFATDVTKPPIDVTYIANEGFLIQAAGKKVLIDALFERGAPNYLTPSPELLDHIATDKGLFADIDLLLVTHVHGDHFNPAMVLRYLRSHPRCQFVAHKQVIDSIRGDESYKDVQKQVHEPSTWSPALMDKSRSAV